MSHVDSDAIFYISVDIEGIAGVVAPWQCAKDPDEMAYRQAVSFMAREAQLVAEAAKAHGYANVWINDAHAHMTNLSIDHFPDWVTLVSGKPKSCAMLAHTTQQSAMLAHTANNPITAMAFVGYHAMASTQNAVLCHTFHSAITHLSLNGQRLGEGGFNALYAAQYLTIPVVFASGDSAFATEFNTLAPQIPTLSTKTSMGYATAICTPWTQVKATYQQTLTNVFASCQEWQNWQAPLHAFLTQHPNSLSKAPWHLELVLANPLCADAIANSPGWSRHDGLTVSCGFDDFNVLYRGLQSAYGLMANLHPWQPVL